MSLGGSGSGDWWRGAVIYQVYPRSFADSDADGVGDLPGLIGRLDHVAPLGVDAIWICPFYPSPQRTSATTWWTTARWTPARGRLPTPTG